MRAPPAAAGKHGACPHCKAVMEIPVTDIVVHEKDIQLGKCTVLVEQGSHHQKDDQILIRFSCVCCNKTLGISVKKAHKKIQCSKCNTLLRLSLPLVENRSDVASSVNGGSTGTDESKIEFECSQCKKPVKVPQQHAGKKGRCPYCKANVDIPKYSTINRFRIPSKPHGEVRSAPAPITIGSGNDDLLAGFVPDNPLQATSWTAATLDSNATATQQSLPATAALAAPSRSRLSRNQQPLKQPAAKRQGLPWESADRGQSKMWATTKLLLFRPGDAFTNMFEDDGLGNPIGYAVAGLVLGTVYLAISSIPVLAIACMLAAEHMPAGIDYNQLAIWYGIGLAAWLAIGALLIPFLMFAGGAILHTGMLLLGGSAKPFETTTRMIGYSLGAVLQLTLLTPLVAPLIIPFYFLLHLGYGMTRSHQKTAGQAFGTLVIFLVVPSVFIGLLVLVAK
jgi:DNA-directed RNA polymerase subunit RPC12/RpoP